LLIKLNIEMKKNSKKIAPIQSIRGMHDILPTDQPWWERVGKVSRDISEFYNFLRIETPIVEQLDLFERSLGEDTDLIQKEMYILKSSSGGRLALRPELTPSLLRAYLQHGLSRISQPLKLFAIGPIFRHENPQAGRFRQFHQADFEIFGGDDDPIYDAQIMTVIYRILETLKLKDLTIFVNSIGCRGCRGNFRKKLQEYYKRNEKDICKDCKRRLTTNPLRLLDCKQVQCQEFKSDAPNVLDYLCKVCNNHFKSVLEFVEELKIPYMVKNDLVRGLDYYNRTVFEVFSEGYGQAIASGGRFDYLSEAIGGRAVNAVGGAIGMERVIEVMKLKDVKLPQRGKNKVFLVHIGDLAKKKMLFLIEELRDAGIAVIESLGRESLKSQLRVADKAGANIALIFGQKEAYEESIIVRDLVTGAQESVPLKKVIDTLKRKLSEKQ